MPTDHTAGWPTDEELAIAMVDGSAELANGDVKWGELNDFARREWIKKAHIAKFYICVTADRAKMESENAH